MSVDYDTVLGLILNKDSSALDRVLNEWNSDEKQQHLAKLFDRAISWGNLGVIETFLQHGADPAPHLHKLAKRAYPENAKTTEPPNYAVLKLLVKYDKENNFWSKANDHGKTPYDLLVGEELQDIFSYDKFHPTEAAKDRKLYTDRKGAFTAYLWTSLCKAFCITRGPRTSDIPLQDFGKKLKAQ